MQNGLLSRSSPVTKGRMAGAPKASGKLMIISRNDWQDSQ
jgi:hypothetical protein